MKCSFLLPIVAVLVSFLWPVHAWSQDTVIKRDKTEVLAIVEEISDSTVTYRRFDNPLGPKYVVSISRIEKIIYENGSVEEFPEPIPETAPETTAPEEVVPVEVSPRVVQYDEQAAVPDTPPQVSDKPKEKTKSGGGFSAGALAVIETVSLSDLSVGGQLPPSFQAYLDFYIKPWFFLGVSGVYTEERIRGYDVTPYPYLTKVSANAHVGFQWPFANTNVFGLGVYAGPSVSFLNKTYGKYFEQEPVWGTCIGVRLKWVVCLSVEYTMNSAVPGNGFTDYWTVGFGIGF